MLKYVLLDDEVQLLFVLEGLVEFYDQGVIEVGKDLHLVSHQLPVRGLLVTDSLDGAGLGAEGGVRAAAGGRFKGRKGFAQRVLAVSWEEAFLFPALKHSAKTAFSKTLC